MQRLPKVPFLSSGDYSYGIYLYGFPFTQALVAMHPVFRGSGLLTAVVALAGVCVAGFGGFSRQAWLTLKVTQVIAWLCILLPRIFLF